MHAVGTTTLQICKVAVQADYRCVRSRYPLGVRCTLPTMADTIYTPSKTRNGSWVEVKRIKSWYYLYERWRDDHGKKHSRYIGKYTPPTPDDRQLNNPTHNPTDLTNL